MKWFSTLIVILFVGAPMTLAAHTSDERYVDGYVVDLSTAPVAPWVGEKVGMSFVFLDPFTFRATTTVTDATLSIDATFRTKKKLQEVIYTSPVWNVVNSGIITDYTFTEEGTYDLHLTFTDTSGKTHVAGFRKQVRDGALPKTPGVTPILFFSTIAAIGALTFVAGRLWNK